MIKSKLIRLYFLIIVNFYVNSFKLYSLKVVSTLFSYKYSFEIEINKVYIDQSKDG